MYLFFTINIVRMAGIRRKTVWSVMISEGIKSIPYALVPIAMMSIADNQILVVLSSIMAGLLFITKRVYEWYNER